jgi:molybdate transport system substrate-binding protein
MGRRLRWLCRRAGLGLVVLASVSNAAGDGGTSGSRELTVFAAASLRDAFGKIAEGFERSHPGVHVRFNYAGSQELRAQLENGAPADVFASADLKQFEGARSVSLVGTPRIFATNEPVIVVPKANPAKVSSLAELPKATRLVIGTPEVPIGAYTVQILDRAKAKYGADFRSRVEARVVSRELNVRQVLNKVSLGEADAGIVYRTDARSAGDRVQVISIPPELNVVAEYPMATTTKPLAPGLAQAWVETVIGPGGQQVLVDYGFGREKP